MKSLREKIKKRPGILTRGVIFRYDDIPVYIKVGAMATIRDYGYKIFLHMAHSPELVPSEFHLFPNMKPALVGC